MRKISASYIFDGYNFYKNGILVINDDGKIIDLINTNGNVKELPFLEYYNGIICPGFVNAHCHLELSFMKSMLTKTKNITGFIKQMLEKRYSFTDEISDSIYSADTEMYNNGIALCGDICNNESSFLVKEKSKIKYINFIEVLGLKNENEKFNNAINILNSAKKLFPNNSFIVPHASYSVSPELFKLIKKNTGDNNSILSFHNQESLEENELFNGIKNELYLFLEQFGLNENTFEKTNSSSFASVLNYLPKLNNILLVHNVFSTKNDVELAQKFLENRYWVFCPKSNLFISNTMPNINNFQSEFNRICVGTDSYASNNSLSIISELLALQNNYEQLTLSQLLSWATINGAKALKADNNYGCFKTNYSPGVILIYDLDLQNLKLTENTKIKRMI